MNTRFLALKAAAVKATPGPYRACKGKNHPQACQCGLIWSISEDFVVFRAEEYDDLEPGPSSAQKSLNALYLEQASPEVVLSLIATVETLELRIAQLEKEAKYRETYIQNSLKSKERPSV